MLFLASDHRGFELKERIQAFIESLKEPSAAGEIRDLSPEKNPEDDYPIIAAELGRLVASDNLNKGILLCGSGVGASAAVNKIRGVRGAIGLSGIQVRAGRHDDDMNVLIIAADYTDEQVAKELVTAFLETPFDTQTERYTRRIEQIARLESE